MTRIILFYLLVFSVSLSYSQSENSKLKDVIILDPVKVSKFEKYPEFKHNLIAGGFLSWKNDHPVEYKKEMWYYTESFYIKRDSLTEGITLNESSIDISRFENQRKATEKAYVFLGGFKDVLVLLPANELIYILK